MKNFRNIALIIFALWSFMFSLNIQSQVNNISQNRTYDTDATKNVVFFIGNNECINITIDLNMMSFQDQNGNYYGFDLGDGNNYQPIPDDWDFEITNLPSPGSELSSDGKTFKYCTGSENPNNTFTIRIKVFDKNTGTEISNLGNVNLTLYIRDKFKIGNGIWNACVSRFILSVSETIDGNNQSACSPYTIKVYRLNEKDAGPIYENIQDSNTWNLDLDIGQYQADITDSCGQVIENYLIDIRDAYTFSVDILFEGFQCFDDNSGRVVVQIKGAQVFQGGDLDGQIKWSLTNANGDIIRSNGTNTGQSNYSSNQGGGPPFDYGVVDLAIEILGLPEGTYTFYFEDANGCTEEKQITIEKSVPITASLLDGAVDQLLCHGDTNGKLCFKASGGWTEPWDGNSINTDAWGAPYSFTLLNLTTGQGYSSGSVTNHFDSSGNQDGYQTCFNNLPSGKYRLTVGETVANDPYDSTKTILCERSFQEFEITEPDPITTAQSTIKGITCKGDDDGAINLVVAGGTSPFTYSWTKSGDTSYSASTEDLSDLSPGTYNVMITDANGCSISRSFTIEEPDTLEMQASILTEILCYGDDGSIKAEITKQSDGPYVFRISGTDFNNNTITPVGVTLSDVNNLSTTFVVKAGNYTVSVTDANGCQLAEENITLTQPDAPHTIDSSTIQNISCFGAADGSIDITVSGGTGVYTYQWSNGASSEDLSNVAPGTYTVTITDANQCSTLEQYTVTEPALLVASGNKSSHNGFEITCNGADDGSIDLTVSGGTSPYVYSWTKTADALYSSSSEDISDLSPGTYQVSVTDANGCSSDQTFTISEPDELLISSSVLSAIGCYDGNANIQVDVTQASVGPYVFTLVGNDYNNQPVSLSSSSLVVSDLDAVFNTVKAGVYTIRVTDRNNCFKELPLTISQPGAITIDYQVSDYNGFSVSCLDSSDGSINISIAGGTINNADYTFSWSTSDGSGLDLSSLNQNGLTAGTYNLIVSDDNGCSIQQEIVLDEPTEITISENISNYSGYQISTSGGSDGTIVLNVVGGTNSFTYQWSTNDGSGLAANQKDQSGLSAGKYTVVVTDSNGCSVTKTYTLEEPTALLISIDNSVVSNIACFEGNTGKIKIDIDQASVGPYTYEIFGTTYTGDPYLNRVDNIDLLTYTFTGLVAGKYQITVTDGNGNSTTTGIKEITQPETPLIVTAVLSTYGNFNVGCQTDNDGSIDITVSGGNVAGNANYTYVWSTTDGSGLIQGDEDQSGLGPGTYTVSVTDENNCTAIQSFSLTQAQPLNYVLDRKQDITCFGDDDGAIEISVTNGTGVYTYDWSSTNGSGLVQGQQDQSALSPGDYKLILSDSCTTLEYNYTIRSPGELEITLDEVQNVLCFGDSTGKISVTVSGGTQPYNYVWVDNFGNTYNRDIGNVFNSGNLSNIPAGTYTLTVTDSNQCSATLPPVEITDPVDLLLSFDKTDLSCYNSNDGTITVTASGGVSPYTYTWSDLGNGSSRDNLAAGTYSVIVKDANECEETVDIVIANAELFDVDPVITQISCFGANDGRIELNFVGGVGNVNVQWTDDSTAGVNRNNLSPGVYSVLITDESSCTIERDFTIIEPQEIEITGIITNAIDCIEPNSGSIDLQVAGGTAPYTFLWSNGSTTENLTNVPANNYLVTVTDSNGCISEKEFEITRQDDLEIILDTELFAICDTREVFQKSTVSFSGGVAPYTITWSNGVVTGSNGEIMDTNVEGSYEVTVTDFLGCSESLIFNVSLPEIGFPEFDYTSFYFTNYGGLSINDPITFINQSSQEYFSVLWNFGDGNTSTDENPTHTYSARGWYDVTLTVEFILGCSYSITKTLYIGDDYEMVIPNAFTPNTDNINETFRPVYYGITSIRLTVYDTWGTLIYYEDSTENEMIGWDGTINGKKAENGNFFYQVSATTYTGNLIDKNGAFTLIR